MSRLNKELGLLQGIALLSTSLLGTGIFVVPALAATAAGSASLWAWLILIALVLPVAFTFAQLGRHFPHAGGAPHLIGRAFGARSERLIALLFLAVLPVGLPAALNIATGFWQAVLPIGRGEALLIQFATLGLMLLLGQRPARASGLVQGLIALAILGTVGLVWWVGDLPLASQPLLPPIDGSWQLIPAALGVMFWCFVGIEAFTHLGEEFKHPRRDFPLALLLGVLLAGLVYWAFSVAVLSFGVYGNEHSDAASLPRLMHRLLGDEARWLVAAVGYLACFASMNVYVQGFARLIWSLADEDKLPSALAVRNRHGVPARALLLVVLICALCAALAAVLQLSVDDLIRYANGNFIVVYLLSMAAGVVLLRGVWRWVAGLSCALCGLVLLALGVDALYALTLLGGFALLDRWRERQRTPASLQS
ncbi:L-methionine/branched-chain amino acid transporter [Aquipseudomonas alcaligenes]|uniref:L-methionine/branched-chain amino acid transporter n=1 Tax=Aquipseudomonas alcaligenes TaxID=43263 RepID=A0AA37FJV5_AQUAC|nr:L-methionine/branched-chain amino acid transporter [Pseudomonas alcaligenes]BCR23642.1 L-methionine/branched-chain amino acid transporter [Pseudomonas alcaligenes]GIZ65093.1 L-methionine/branched-chain amino acid transporter [Pseudomonas alcaligenes]GIZ69582.1 L-methionine/branched-chain amino acid transporter [Pseudomonas alcaligenes]GIZ73934.1 L-methionine/branched-chain amino acid transporter [Pseudomonas alcaligenes]GIZ78295.1 L-methionine/branched-chain amino acid transporter [Pseudomo